MIAFASSVFESNREYIVYLLSTVGIMNVPNYTVIVTRDWHPDYQGGMHFNIRIQNAANEYHVYAYSMWDEYGNVYAQAQITSV
uniref:Uncharacterized protein n=1 Tax=viral metagenome TaxID=1070528 RepID=A0A6C0M259_9ZZZZ